MAPKRAWSCAASAALAFALLAAIAAAGSGCGSRVSIEELAGSYLEALCEWRVGCGFEPSHELCVAVHEPISGVMHGDGILFAQIVQSVEAGLVDYDSSAGQQCLDALQTGVCRPWEPYPKACREMFTGLVDEGEECMFGYECASRRCSIPLDCEEACCAGTCDESPGIAGVGEECSNGTNRPCEEGTYCNVWEEPAVCMLYTEVGESCDPMSACAPGAYCSFEDGADEGECRPRAAEGERCTGVAGCDRMDLWCNPGTETCEPALGPGESCEMDRASGCVWYTTCDLEVTDTCVAKPTIGDPCLVGTECGGSLACHEGSCAPKQAQPICER